MKSVRTILAAKGRNAESMEVGDTVSVNPDSNALMPVVIEKTDKRKLCVGHYYRQTGDQMSDPEVLFKVENQNWLPIRFIQDPNVERIDPTGLDLGGFLEIWDRNLRLQGYVDTVR